MNVLNGILGLVGFASFAAVGLWICGRYSLAEGKRQEGEDDDAR